MSEPETRDTDEQEDEAWAARAVLLVFVVVLLVIAAFYLEAAWASGDPVKLRVAIAHVIIGALSFMNFGLATAATGNPGAGVIVAFFTGVLCYNAAYLILAWLARTP